MSGSEPAENKVSAFFESYPKRHYKKGQILIYGGEVPPGIFYLDSGEVRQYDITHKGDEIVLNVYKSPAFFPMNWAINQTPNDYFFEAFSNVSLRLAPVEDTLRFIKANPAVMYDLLSRLYRGTDGLLRRMKYLMKGTAESRAALELLIACQRFGKRQNGSYVLTVPENELAARSGLTRETISRELHKLHERGLVVITHRSIVIKDISALEKLLDQDI